MRLATSVLAIRGVREPCAIPRESNQGSNPGENRWRRARTRAFQHQGLANAQSRRNRLLAPTFWEKLFYIHTELE
jgi:hypothetical protein